jgi:hypothetical protein
MDPCWWLGHCCCCWQLQQEHWVCCRQQQQKMLLLLQLGIMQYLLVVMWLTQVSLLLWGSGLYCVCSFGC